MNNGPSSLSPLPALRQQHLVDLLRRMRELTVSMYLDEARDMAAQARALIHGDPYWLQRLAICELHLNVVTSPGPECLEQASDLLVWAERHGDRQAQAAALLTQAVVMRRLRRFGSALQQAQRARQLFDDLHQHADAQFMLPFLCTLLYHAERYGELIETGEAQLAERLKQQPPMSRIDHFIVLTHIASAHAAENNRAPGSYARALGIGHEALSLVRDAEYQQVRYAAHANLLKWHFHAGQHFEALAQWHDMLAIEASSPELPQHLALRGPRQLAQALVCAMEGDALHSIQQLQAALTPPPPQAAPSQPLQRELAMCWWRVAESAGLLDQALSASQCMHSLELRRRQEHVQWFHDDLAEQQRVARLQAQNVVLSRHGATLRHDLQQRNEALAQLIVQLDQEVAQRHQAEQALHRAHDTLEALIEQRSAELHRTVDRYFAQEKIAAMGQLLASVASALNAPSQQALQALETLRSQAHILRSQLQGRHASRAVLLEVVGAIDKGCLQLDALLTRCAELNNRFKAVAQLGQGGPAVKFDLAAVLRGCVNAHDERMKTGPMHIVQKVPTRMIGVGHPDTYRQVLGLLLDQLLPAPAGLGMDGPEAAGLVHLTLSPCENGAQLSLSVPHQQGHHPAMAQQMVRHLVDAVLRGEMNCSSTAQRWQYDIRLPLQPAAPSDTMTAPATLVGLRG